MPSGPRRSCGPIGSSHRSCASEPSNLKIRADVPSLFDQFRFGTLCRYRLRAISTKQSNEAKTASRCATALRALHRARRPAMAAGNVKWFNVQKGYGFIQPSDGSKDVFIHISAVERAGVGNLVEG